MFFLFKKFIFIFENFNPNSDLNSFVNPFYGLNLGPNNFDYSKDMILNLRMKINLEYQISNIVRYPTT